MNTPCICRCMMNKSLELSKEESLKLERLASSPIAVIYLFFVEKERQ